MLDNYSVTKNPDNRIHLFDPVALINDGFDGGYRASSKPRRPTKSYGNFEDAKIMKTNNDEIRFDVVDKRYEVLSFDDADDDVEVCTPRLWKQTNNDTTRPRPRDEQFDEEEEEEEEKSSSRTKEIARGRRELMDMVKDLPESSYELSLKDLVEYKSEITEAHTNKVEEEKTVLQESNGMVRDVSMEKTKKEKNKKLGRTKSADNDKVLLKTSVFPSFFGSKKKTKKKQGLNGGDSFKAGSGAKVGSGEKDWWKRKSCISSESDRSNGLSSKSGSGDSSSSSSSSSLCSTTIARSGKSFSTVCCLFIGKKTAN